MDSEFRASTTEDCDANGAKMKSCYISDHPPQGGYETRRNPDSPKVTAEHSPSADDDHRVVPFRRRGVATQHGQRWRWLGMHSHPASPPELAKFEGTELDDDYRHRMLVNTAAIIFTITLASAGAWLVTTIADMRKNQDCYLSGRRNCTPIDPQTLRLK